jgi:hypothetical protein
MPLVIYGNDLFPLKIEGLNRDVCACVLKREIFSQSSLPSYLSLM